jgi:hypothetical protein
VIDAFSLSQPIQDARLLVMAFGRDDQQDGFPHGFFCCVSEQGLGAGIP